jgi:hypothetical protein
MPPLPSPGQVVKLVMSWQNNDVSAENIFHFSYTGSGTLSLGELETFADDTSMGPNFLAPWVGASVDTVMLTGRFFTDLSSDTGVTYGDTPSFTGTNTGEALPASTAVCVSHEIARRYRGGHPRTYMMVGSAGDFVDFSNKNWQTAFLANIQAGWNTWQSAFPKTLGARTWNPCNVSYYETVGGVRTIRATPLVDPIISQIARVRMCTQRRRLGKVGG